MEYMERVDRESRQAADELTTQAQELGLSY
jgi:hypothetical protein